MNPSLHRFWALACCFGWFAALGAASAPVRAAGLRDLQDGWVLAAAETSGLLERADGAPAADVWPAPGGWWLAAGAARLYGMPELPVSMLAAGAAGSTGNLGWRAGCSWEMTGGELFRQDLQNAFVALGGSLMLGAAFRREAMRIGGEPAGAATAWAVTAERRQRVGEGTWLRVRVEMAVGESDAADAAARRPLAVATVLRPAEGLGLGVAVDRNRDGGPELSLDLGVALTARIGLGLRADPETGSCGPVTWWKAGAMLVRTSHVAHPDLGTTHRVIITVGVPKADWR